MLRLVSRIPLLSVRMVVLLFRSLAVTVVQASVSNFRMLLLLLLFRCLLLLVRMLLLCSGSVSTVIVTDAFVQLYVIICQDAVALFRLC
jgi:hypothetical protein